MPLAIRCDWFSRSELAAVLWPTLERPRALANLRKTLHQARALPGGDTIETSAEAVRWVVATDLRTPGEAPALRSQKLTLHLGKYGRTLSPGLNFVIPFLQRVAYKHSLKEVHPDVPSQVCITKDNTQLQVELSCMVNARSGKRRI